MQPIAPIADAEIGNAALNARIDGRDVDGIAAAGAAGAVGGDAIRIDLGACLHVGDRATDIFSLPSGHDPTALVALAAAPTTIVKAKTSVARRTKLFEHHDVVLGVFKAEETRTLDDSRIGLALLGIRKIEHAGELNAFAVKIDFFRTHGNSQNLSCSNSSIRSNSSNRLIPIFRTF